MSLLFDTSTGQTASTTTPYTFSHTCTGSNLILVVGVYNETGDNVTGITYNSVAMTLITKNTNNTNSYLYYLVNPTTGANTVSIAFSGGGSQTLYGFSASYKGSKQSGQADSSGTNNSASSATLQVATTVVASGCWLVGLGGIASTTVSADTGTTARNVVSGLRAFGDSNGVVGTGSQHLDWKTSGAAATTNGITASIIGLPSGFMAFL